ncbi:MAG: methyltransferase domain-containing protein [Ruegeria sp.]
MSAIMTDRVQRSFSRSFHSYHDTAGQQADIANQLAARLVDLGAPSRFSQLFEFGCGTGHLTKALYRSFAIDNAILNDLTPEAGQTATEYGAQFLLGDIRHVTWPVKSDLIASSSTIQWLEKPEAVLSAAARNLTPGGWLAVSGFGCDQYRELAELGSDARAPGLRDADELARAVTTADGRMEIVELWQERRKLWFDTPHHVLRHLRSTGVNGRASRVWTRATLASFSDSYSRAYATPEGVCLTYHPIWVIARKRD